MLDYIVQCSEEGVAWGGLTHVPASLLQTPESTTA